MFTPREAMAYKGQLPEQRNPKLQPDLLNLLAIQSAMRAKKDAENQLAAALGNPNQPTVADALKQKAAQELQSSQEPSDQEGDQSQPEKMGLAALAAKNQGAQPQVAPQAPQGMPQGMPQGAPQGAPKMMAAGGLTSVRSNLPSNYQAGGIVAFEGGGSVAEAQAKLSAINEGLRTRGLQYRRDNPEAYQSELAAKEQAEQEMQDALEAQAQANPEPKASQAAFYPSAKKQPPLPMAAPKVNPNATSSSAAGMAGYVPPKRFVEPSAMPSGAMDEVTAERVQILNREMQKAQMAANDPAATPEMKSRAAGDVAALTREIALVSKKQQIQSTHNISRWIG